MKILFQLQEDFRKVDGILLGIYGNQKVVFIT